MEENILPEASNHGINSNWDFEFTGKPGGGSACEVGCIYCNQAIFGVDENGRRIANSIETNYADGYCAINDRLYSGRRLLYMVEPETLVEDLLKYTYYSPNHPILIRNQWEPGLDWKSSARIGELLVNSGHRSGLIYLTKKPPLTDDECEPLQNLIIKGGMPIIKVAYSGLPRGIEPGSQHRALGIQTLSRNRIPTTISYRPIIAPFNDSDESIQDVLLNAGQYVDAIAISGLSPDKNLLDKIHAVTGIRPDSMYYEASHSFNKHYPNNFVARVRQIAGSMGIQTPIYDKNACATSAVLTARYSADYPSPIALWARRGSTPDFSNCKQICTAEQLLACEQASQMNIDEVSQLATPYIIKWYEAEGVRIEEKDINIEASGLAGHFLLRVAGKPVESTKLFLLDRITGQRFDNLISEVEIAAAVKTAGLEAEHFTIRNRKPFWDIEIPTEEWEKYNRDLNEFENDLRRILRARINIIISTATDG